MRVAEAAGTGQPICASMHAVEAARRIVLLPADKHDYQHFGNTSHIIPYLINQNMSEVRNPPPILGPVSSKVRAESASLQYKTCVSRHTGHDGIVPCTVQSDADSQVNQSVVYISSSYLGLIRCLILSVKGNTRHCHTSTGAPAAEYKVIGYKAGAIAATRDSAWVPQASQVQHCASA